MARIVLATIGSLGDLHPFIAIGRSLVDRGDRVLLAVPEDAVAKVRAAGLEAAPILPGFATICARLGLSIEDATARVLDDPDFVVDEILMPCLGTSTAALDLLAGEGDIIVGSVFAVAAAIVAEKRRVPLATIMLQPMSLFSAWQPPVAPRFEPMRHRPRHRVDRAWNRALFLLARHLLRRRHGRLIDAVRADHGLRPGRGFPLLDHGPATAAVLCCWSSVLGRLPPDAPSTASLTGFPFLDREQAAGDVPDPVLRSFLSAGTPPVVFTLGSVAVGAAGRFYADAAAAVGASGIRGLMLTGRPGPTRQEGDCLSMSYAPHAAVFPHAALVVHHGGIGTIGQALRAGCPQIVVPHVGDQFDNAARLHAAGLAVTIDRRALDARSLAAAIERIAATAADRIIALCR